MILCHINPKKLIKFSYSDDFDIVGNDDLGYYAWNLIFGDEYDNRHDLQIMFFDAYTKKFSHSQSIKAVQNAVIEDDKALHNLANGMLWYSKKFGNK